MSEGAEESAEKSHEPSERRLEDARREGDIARSADAQAAAAYLGLALALGLAGRDVAGDLGGVLRRCLEDPVALSRAMLSAGGTTGVDLAGAVAKAAAPLLLAPGLAVLVLLLASRGIAIAPSKVAPKLSRISPMENAAQKYGPRGLVEFAKAAAKLTLVLAVLAVSLAGMADTLTSAVHVAPRLVPRAYEAPLWDILAGALAVALAVGTADFLYQRHAHRKRLMMSHEEVKRERRDSEGDPQMNARRRERARALADNRMLQKVAEADVVVTNPTHYAVALAWDRARGGAPVCIAKGVDEVAARIRARAAEAKVPLREDPPTARALFAATALGAEIRPEHYRAVAAAILFADAVRTRRREGGAG